MYIRQGNVLFCNEMPPTTASVNSSWVESFTYFCQLWDAVKYTSAINHTSKVYNKHDQWPHVHITRKAQYTHCWKFDTVKPQYKQVGNAMCAPSLPNML